MMESQSCDAEPPPPPKPELRYPGITRGNTEGKCSLTHCSISHLRFLLWNPKLTWCYCGGFLSVSCRVQSSEQSPSHPHHVQIQAHLQPWQEPHSAHSRLRQPGNTWTHTHTVYSEFRCKCVFVRRESFFSICLCFFYLFNFTLTHLHFCFFPFLISCRPSWFGFSVAFCWSVSVSDCSESISSSYLHLNLVSCFLLFALDVGEILFDMMNNRQPQH